MDKFMHTQAVIRKISLLNTINTQLMYTQKQTSCQLNLLHNIKSQQIMTSNVTGRHRGPKGKFWAGYRVLSLKRMGWLQCAITTTHAMLRLFFSFACGIVHFLCALHVFEIQASSSSPRLPLCQISSLSRAPLLS